MKRAWGKRREPGTMNKLEAEYARMLEEQKRAGEIREYAFESVKFKLADKTWYTPDFFVERTDGELQVHEVKGGLFPEHNRVKLKVAAALLPMRVILAQFKNKRTGWEIAPV